MLIQLKSGDLQDIVDPIREWDVQDKQFRLESVDVGKFVH